MPRIHERDFRVRHYECSPFGLVNSTWFARYMQEAAFDASAAAGYDPAAYAAMGTHWLVRETQIEFLRPLRYGDVVRVRTWVDDFRRVRSRRAYLLTNVATGDTAARGSTDWVYVDSRTGHPATIQPALVAAFFPEGAPAPAAARRPFPALSAPPGAFTLRRRVMWQDLDQAGHVNNAQYLAFISDCAFEAARVCGWPASRMVAEGFGALVRRLRIEYRQPALLDDDLAVSTWVYRPRRVTATRAFTITRAADQALIAQAEVVYAWLSLATGRPMPVPAELLAELAPNQAEAPEAA